MVHFVWIFFTFLFIKKFFMKKTPSPTASGAIIMAIGIFINGAIVNFPLLEINFGKSMTLSIFILWLLMGTSYITSLYHKTFTERHSSHPIKSFSIGTWIAGTSVCAMAVYREVPTWEYIPYIMIVISFLLWGYYMLLCFKNFKVLFSSHIKENVHGVLLLSTVSTQSLVLVVQTVLINLDFELLSQIFILLGLIFYFASFYLITRRYIKNIRSIDLDRDWFNTNCILHGAMSITGLASTLSQAINPNMILAMWIWVIIWFSIVELIELNRARIRVQKYGFVRGLCVYDVTQWSRNFTFGMLFAFTFHFDLKSTMLSSDSVLFYIHDTILHAGGYIVLALLAWQVLLILKSHIQFTLSNERIE